LNTDFTYNGVTYTHNTDQEAVALGDNFLSKIIPMIMDSTAYKNDGAIVIWFDETEGKYNLLYAARDRHLSARQRQRFRQHPNLYPLL
jgi:hypothetical protein